MDRTTMDWDKFFAAHWNRRPGVFQFGEPLVSLEDVFQAVLTRVDLARKGRDIGRDIRLFAGDRMLSRDTAGFGARLPMASDKNFEGYERRLASEQKITDFMLIVDHIQAYSPVIWDRILEFFQGLFGNAGIPSGQLDVDVFIGHYDRTPFGVHGDTIDGFMFVLQGEKRMQTWPSAVWRGYESPTKTTNYEPYLADATTLPGGPGALVYWPADYWHIAECEGLTISLNLSFKLPVRDVRSSPAVNTVFGPLRELVRQRVDQMPIVGTYPIRPGRLQDAAGSIPTSILAVANSVRSIVNSKEFDQMVLEAWLRHLSRYGFQLHHPPVSNEPLADSDRVRVDPRFPILWAPYEDGIICACNGHGTHLENAPAVVALLDKLNSGSEFQVGSLCDEFAQGDAESAGQPGTFSRADVREVLEDFARFRGLRKVTE